MDKSRVSSEPYWEVHPGNGPYLLLLHGFLCSRAQWIPNIEALSYVTRPVIVELLGHGRSPAPESPAAYHPEGYIEAFEKIREHLGISEWLLCGHSLGAGITMRYALQYPERIIAQVFTNTTSALGETDSASETRRSVAQFAENLLQMGHEGLERLPIHPVNAHRLRADVREALVRDAADISLLGAANAMRYTLPEVSVREEIHKNKVPTLLVCGRLEKRFKPFRDYAEAHMPLLEIVDLDAGHPVNIEAAEGFNDSLAAFFRKHISDRKSVT